MPRPRNFDEDTVVAAARDRFWGGGYAATSVDDLTTATGLGKGSLYGAFGDKHTLFVRALDGYCVDAMDRIAAQLQQPGVSAYDRLAGHVRAADADVDRVVGESLTRWHGYLVECIAEAQRDGTVRTDADPEALATTLLGLMRGFEALRKGGTEPDQIEAAGEQALALVAG